MTLAFPFLTAYDPQGSSEGTLDPLGLYQIADQLAVNLVPSVRERMQRIRFLTAIAVGSRVTEGMHDESTAPDVSPQLVWEWLVVEAFVRAEAEREVAAGVAGVQVVRRALRNDGSVTAATYLKTPRIFGFHGVYKRLAVHLGITDVNLSAGPEAARLVDAWAAGLSQDEGDAKTLIADWTRAVKRSLQERPSRTSTGWGAPKWRALGAALHPDTPKAKEKRLLRELMLAEEPGRSLGALRHLWDIAGDTGLDSGDDRGFIKELARRAPEYAHQCKAIQAYERFARCLQDAFDAMRLAASRGGPERLSDLADQKPVKEAAVEAPRAYESVLRAFTEVASEGASRLSLFLDRFGSFAEAMSPTDLLRTLCVHHEEVQLAKSAGGKRAWFDRTGSDRIYLRPMYRLSGWEPSPGRLVHAYRSAPIQRFREDLL